MALVKCKECGNGVSSTANTCPQCGAQQGPTQYSLGKLVVAIVGALLLYQYFFGDDTPVQPAIPPVEDTSLEGTLIPRSSPEKATYFLISVTPDGNFLKTVHSRVSPQNRGYSLTRIDCSKQRYQDLGYGENNQLNIKMYGTPKWTDAINGSSKHDLIVFTCGP